MTIPSRVLKNGGPRGEPVSPYGQESVLIENTRDLESSHDGVNLTLRVSLSRLVTSRYPRLDHPAPNDQIDSLLNVQRLSEGDAGRYP
jgi:hypothetical protein